MKWVMEVLTATPHLSLHNKLWAMIFQRIMLTVQPPMSHVVPSLIRTLSVDIVSVFPLSFYHYFGFGREYNVTNINATKNVIKPSEKALFC